MCSSDLVISISPAGITIVGPLVTVIGLGSASFGGAEVTIGGPSIDFLPTIPVLPG